MHFTFLESNRNDFFFFLKGKHTKENMQMKSKLKNIVEMTAESEDTTAHLPNPSSSA